MEEGLNNVMDARSIYERSIKKFSKCSPRESSEKEILWRAYELMESRLGNTVQAQNVYSRYIRECMSSSNYNDHFNEKNILQSSSTSTSTSTTSTTKEIINNENLNNNNNEIEVYRISSSRGFVDG